MTKITLEDNLHSIIFKMSEGNPGAMTTLMKLAEKTPEIDPDNALGSLGNILNLDSFGIYGASIYGLFNDKCDRDIRKMCLILRATQMGYFNSSDLLEISNDQTRTLNISDEEFTAIDKKVCEELKLFKKP